MTPSQTFSPPAPLNTAVLFLVFNRLDTTKQVFEAIRQAKPPRLYIAADGAREQKEGEAQKVQAVRAFITENVDWECEVHTLFREENYGCKMAVSGAIEWFFENEDAGIILEDDCLPSQSFFWFCEELLDKYRNDMRVWHIAGNNFHFGWQRDTDYSYYFSYYGSIWGWATWRDRWEHYTVDMHHYDEVKAKNYFWDLFGNRKESRFRLSNFEAIRRGMDTWDFQWAYTRFINSGLSIVPRKNLVKNLGFGEDATHTRRTKDRRSNMEVYELEFPLRHPKFMIRDKVSDDRFFRTFIHSRLSLVKSVAKRLMAR